MPDYTFQVLTIHHDTYGHEVVSNVSTEGLGGIRPGILVDMCSSGGSLTEANDAAVRPTGIAYGSRVGVYRPTGQWYAAGEPHSIIFGRGLALLGVDLFTAGSLPSACNTKLYAGANGTWAESGTFPVGRYIRAKAYHSSVGVGTATTVGLIEFNIAPYTNP